MLANPPEPVGGVGGVWLAAVQQAMPVAAGRRVDVLADRVRLVEEVVIEPQAGEAMPRSAMACGAIIASAARAASFGWARRFGVPGPSGARRSSARSSAMIGP
jgi:hypothetical protein